LGNACWAYPDQMTAFIKQYANNMNLSLKPLPLSEVLQMESKNGNQNK